jgi:hypothetical protein
MGGARFLHRAPTHALFLAKESTTQDAEYKSLGSQTRLEKSELEYFGIVGQSDGFELEEGRKKLRSPTLGGADAFVATINYFTIYVY